MSKKKDKIYMCVQQDDADLKWTVLTVNDVMC